MGVCTGEPGLLRVESPAGAKGGGIQADLSARPGVGHKGKRKG